MLRKLMFLVSVILVSISCVAEVAAATDYFPLYEGFYFTERGFDPFNGYYFYSGGCSSTKVVNGATCYVVALPDGDNPAAGYYAMAKVGGAVMVFEVYDPEYGVPVAFDPPQLYLPANPVLGTEWTYTDPQPGGELTTATVVADNETVTTPAGTFHNCLKVKRQEQSGTYQYHWYASGVGEVKFYDEGGTVKETEEMVSFSQGASCDTTPPTTPVVRADGADTYGNALHGVWTSTDPQSGVVEYKVAVSTTPNEGGIIPDGWQSVGGLTEFTGPGLPALVDGGTYYLLAKARNGAGLWSGIGLSDGITVHLSAAGDSPWPLQVGNLWEYQIHNAESGDRVGYLRVNSASQVGGQTKYNVSQENYYFGESHEFTAGRVGQDLLLYSFDGQDATTPLLFAKAPPTTGLAWSCEDFGGGMTYFEVLADDETVTTPAGTFTGCAKVKQTWENYPSGLDHFWWKPGVGQVQTDSYEDWDWVNVSEHRELAAWHVTTSPSDITPPTTPLVTAEASDCYGNILRASYASSDPESTIVEYQVAISTTPDESGILPAADWRNNGVETTYSSPSLSGLVEGAAYYILVKARNSANLWSEIGVSNGITVHLSAAGDSAWPLRVGNFWQYQIHNAETGDRIGYWRVSSASQVGGQIRYTINDEFVYSEEPYELTAAWVNEDLLIYSLGGQIADPPVALLKTPLTTGLSWSWPDFGGGGMVYFEVLADDETVTTPAGTFTGCAKVRQTWEAQCGMDVFWVKPGVGEVQSDSYYDCLRAQVSEHRELAGWHVTTPETVTGVKLKADGSSVSLDGGIISAAWPNAFYVEAEDRHSGIRVQKSGHGLTDGKRANVVGIVRTNADGERYIDASVAVEAGDGSAKPLGMVNRVLGGGDWRYDAATGAGQKGITGVVGLNNIGLLAKICGRVTASGVDPRASTAWFYIDDGSNVRDGTGIVGIYCEAPFGIDPPAVDYYVSVEGISGCEFYNDSLVNVLRIDSQDDIETIEGYTATVARAAVSGDGIRPRDRAKSTLR